MSSTEEHGDEEWVDTAWVMNFLNVKSRTTIFNWQKREDNPFPAGNRIGPNMVRYYKPDVIAFAKESPRQSTHPNFRRQDPDTRHADIAARMDEPEKRITSQFIDESRIAAMEAKLGISPGENQSIEDRIIMLEEIQRNQEEEDAHPKVNRPGSSKTRQ